MLRSRPVRAAIRTLAISGLGLASVVFVAGCGSGGGEGTATLPPGVSVGAGASLPDDVTVTRPPEEDPVEEPPAEEPIVAPPAEEPTVAPAEDQGVDVADDTVAGIEDDATDDEMVWWPWVLGLLLVVAVVVAVAASRSRRGSSDWTTRALTAIDTADALTTHLLAMDADGLVVVARDDAQRLAQLTVTIRDLVRSAPDGRTRGSIDGLQGPLVQLHAAVDMVSLSPSPTPAELALVNQWANALHVQSSMARSTLTTSSS